MIAEQRPTPERIELASAYKIAGHREKVQAYLDNKAIFPISLELDLTSRCSRTCPDCPSTRAATHWHLDYPFLDRLYGMLSGQVYGLLLTGGEPTLSPLFAAALAEARRRGFQEIAVVTNGSQLDDEPVVQALLEYAATIRLSLYDWENASCGGAKATLDRLTRLRRRIEREKSELQIGVSILTSSRHCPLFRNMLQTLIAAGAHWVYFHPHCRNWSKGRPRPDTQSGVLNEIEYLQAEFTGSLNIYITRERYEETVLAFSGYHAAHFMLVVGADKKNYLAAEVKYHPDHVIADLANGFPEDFLWKVYRQQRIMAYHSQNYPALASRHRGVLYNDFIERLKRNDEAAKAKLLSLPSFRYPHIL